MANNWWCLRFNEQITQKLLLYRPPLDTEFLHNKHCWALLAWSLLCPQQTPSNLKKDIILMEIICLPRLFRTTTMKDSVDAPPLIPSSNFTCIWVSVHFETLQLQTLASFHLCPRAESKQDRPQKVPSKGWFKGPQRLPSSKEEQELVDKYPSFPHTWRNNSTAHSIQLLRESPVRLSPRCLKQEAPH